MKRQLFIFFIAIAALFGSLVTVFATIEERDYKLRGYVDSVQDKNLPYRVSRLGVNADLTQYNSIELQRNLNRMDEAHIIWVRQLFAWDQIEPQPNQFTWDKWDVIVKAVDDHPNLRLIAVLMNTPAWARQPQASGQITAPPRDPAHFAHFAQAVANHFGTSIDYYQIWDEPNLTANWGGLNPQASGYSALLQSAYVAVHGADPHATVIAGALAPTTETGPRNISDLIYLQDLYTLGAKTYMDAVAAKPYGFSQSPEDRTVNPNVLNFSRMIALREEMVLNGDSTKAIWASEFGWNSLPSGWNGKVSIWGSVNADEQVEYTIAALNRAEREWPWVAGMIVQHWQPVVAKDDATWGFALIDQEHNPTRLWNALKEQNPPTFATNGLFSAVTAHANYSGVWTFSDLGADIGWVQDSQLTFDFKGQDIALLLRQDHYVAYLYPTIDGQPSNATPRDASGNSYIVLTSPSLKPELNLIAVGKNLSLQMHKLHAVADRGWDRWAIAGYAVSDGNLAEPYNHQIAIALVTVFVAAVGTIVTGWGINWENIPLPFSYLNRSLNTTTQLLISVITSLALMIGMLLTWGDGVPNLFRRDSVPIGLAIVALGLLKLQPGFILTVLAVVVLLVIIYNRLEIGLTLTIFWAPFFLFPVELYRFSFPISEIMILLTASAWIFRQLSSWGQYRQANFNHLNYVRPIKQMKQWSPIDWFIAGWFTLGLVSLIWAERRGQAITELRVMIAEPVLFYVIFRTTHLDKKAILRIVDAMILAGLVVAIISLWQFFNGQAIITAEDGSRRLAGVYGSPNNIGLFLGRCIPFVLAFFLVSKIDLKRRIVAAMILVAMGLTVVLSKSAGAIFIGVPAASIAVIILVLGRRARLVLVILLSVALVAFIISLQSARFARVLEFDSGTNFFRIRAWQSAINMIRDHPITGIGLDQFLYAFRGHYIMPDAENEPNLSHPHNILLDFWVRLGFFGVVLLIGLFIVFWRKARYLYQLYQTDNPYYFAISVGMIGCMVDIVTHGLIDNSVFVQDLVYIFVLLLALTVTLPNIRAIDEPPI
jgi:O-antigen ligase